MFFEDDIIYGCREERRESDETRFERIQLQRGEDLATDPVGEQQARVHLGILYPKNNHWSICCENVDMVEPVLEPRILDAHVLFLKGHLPKHGGAPATATRWVWSYLPNRDVPGP
jgi:hypothetical protein